MQPDLVVQGEDVPASVARLNLQQPDVQPLQDIAALVLAVCRPIHEGKIRNSVARTRTSIVIRIWIHENNLQLFKYRSDNTIFSAQV